MRFPNHVSITRDYTMMYDYIPVIATVHQQLLVNGPVVTPVPAGPYIEAAATMWWPPGYVTQSHKLTTTVFHNHLTIAQKGHDLGMMLIHVGIPPNDLYIPVNMLNSSRKAMFEAGEVKANGKPIACCTMIDWAIIPTPMKCCSKIPALHTGCGMSVLLNSMIVGMHAIDLLAGVASIVTDILLDRLDLPPPIADRIEPLVDIAPSLVGALVRLAGQEWGGYYGDASLQIEVASGVELTVTRSGEDQQWSGQVEVKQDLTFGDVHGSVTVTEGAEGQDPTWEAVGGANVFSDGTYEGSIDSEGQTGSTVQHPGVRPSLRPGLLGAPTDGGGAEWSSGANPMDGGFIPGMNDLPQL